MAKEELLEMRRNVVELTPYDLTKGRITYRFMPGRGGPGPT
jgi:translation initiation factor IF-1